MLSALEAIITRTGGFALDGEVEREHWPFRAFRHTPASIAATGAPRSTTAEFASA